MTILDSAMASNPQPAVIPVVQETLKTLSQRMGKIAQAVALITTVVRDPYQLMNQLLRYTTQTVSDSYQLEYAPETVTVQDVHRISIGLRHIIDACELCHTAGLLSDMNFQIIHHELRQVEQFVHEKLETYCIGQVTYPLRVPEIQSGSMTTSQPTLDQFFSSEGVVEKKSVAEYVPVQKNESATKSTTVQPVSVPEKTYKDIHVVLPTSKLITKPVQKSHEDFRIPSPVISKPISGEDKKERRDAIMKTIRSKGQVTIKDISENIRGCSEKTIQRDLQELIQHGVLIREGEKRWAVYKLAMKNV